MVFDDGRLKAGFHFLNALGAFLGEGSGRREARGDSDEAEGRAANRTGRRVAVRPSAGRPATNCCTSRAAGARRSARRR